MSDSEKHISLVNAGKMARIILEGLGPILNEIKEESQARFINENFDALKGVAYQAELRILRDIENKLASKIHTSDRVLTERQHGDRSTDEQY